MAELQPVILVDPELTISGVSLKCLLSHVELNPDVSTVEITTACGIRTYPGTLKWTLNASLYHSFDPQGTNEVLTGGGRRRTSALRGHPLRREARLRHQPRLHRRPDPSALHAPEW